MNTRPKSASENLIARSRSALSQLNLHWIGLALLGLVNIYLAAHLVLLWHASANYDAAAFAQQKADVSRAAIAAEPLRGVDEKLVVAKADADEFYKDRLPTSYSDVVAELGALTKKSGVRLSGANYSTEVVLPGNEAQLTELNIDARLSGDYRPLVLFINSLERDKMFFIIKGVTLNGQQSGTVNLRLRLVTYLRGVTAKDIPDAALASVSTRGGTR